MYYKELLQSHHLHHLHVSISSIPNTGGVQWRVEVLASLVYGQKSSAAKMFLHPVYFYWSARATSRHQPSGDDIVSLHCYPNRGHLIMNTGTRSQSCNLVLKCGIYLVRISIIFVWSGVSKGDLGTQLLIDN